MPLQDPIFILGYVTAFLLSLAFHESAHAWMALKCGDDFAARQGRISMNPIVHMDIWWTVVMPMVAMLGGMRPFGGGKPVPVNVFHLRYFQRDNLKVSLAGPASNFILAGAMLCLLYLFRKSNPDEIRYVVLFEAFVLNVWLGLFNLLPLPPLDGFSIPVYFMNRDTAERAVAGKDNSFIFLIAAFLFGPYLLFPIVQKIFHLVEFLKIPFPSYF